MVCCCALHVALPWCCGTGHRSAARRGRALAWAGLAALLAGALTVCVPHICRQALPPALEGKDIQVTGIVAAMPQPGDVALRLRLAVESARLDGAAVQLPR